MLLPLWTPSPSMQREALPTGAVKPDVEAEPEDQLRQFRCASDKVISIDVQSLRASSFVDPCGEVV